jgi:hypothetical protein
VHEIDDGHTVWRFDEAFLGSNWTCIWGRGCLGILDEPAEHLQQGCCSVGAELTDEGEAMLLSAMAAMLDPERFQFHAEAEAGGIFRDEERNATRVVEGACIFLNRPGFPGGVGCALHLGALDAGDPPLEWKPAVCWQLPVRVDWAPTDDGRETATVRGWTRDDWGDEGETMHWCCTEGDRAYVGDRPVVESLADELTALVGKEVYVQLRRRMTGTRDGSSTDL